MWRQEATFGGDWIVASGTQLFRYKSSTNTATLLGSIPGTGLCQIDGTDKRAVVVRDGTAYSTDGASVTTIVMPNDVDPYTPNPAKVGSVAVINGYILMTVLGTQRFYWITPGAVNPDPLNFASAERLPDPIVSVRVISDEIWFMGASGPEVWMTTGDLDSPFQRTAGRVYSDGCLTNNTCVNAVYEGLPCLLWVTDTKSVVLAQGQIAKVSDESVEELLKTATNLRAWFFRHNRHDFYILTCDQFTLAFDMIMKSWAKWDSYRRDNWKAHLGLQSPSGVFAGSLESNQVWQFDEGSADSDGPVIREVSGLIDNPGAAQPCSNVFVKVNSGWSPQYDFEPRLELRWSDDQGGTWSDYVSSGLGNKGEYNETVQFRSLGQVRRPGRVFEFRFTDNARFRIDYASMNEKD
jgi:hypothetical protein